MDKKGITESQAPSATMVDDAVGVPTVEEKHWFVAVVNNRSELKCGAALEKMGYEVFVPTQNEVHDYRNRARKTVKRILLPAKILILCTEEQRHEIVNTPFVKRFMVDHTAYNSAGGHPILTIPDSQIKSFRIAIANADSCIIAEDAIFEIGDAVIVKSGQFAGMEGNIVLMPDGKKKVVVSLGSLACIKLSVLMRDIKKKKTHCERTDCVGKQ